MIGIITIIINGRDQHFKVSSISAIGCSDLGEYMIIDGLSVALEDGQGKEIKNALADSELRFVFLELTKT